MAESFTSGYMPTKTKIIMEVDIKGLKICVDKFQNLQSNNIMLYWIIKDHTFQAEPSSIDLKMGII